MIILRSFLNQAPRTKKHHHWHANLYRAGGSWRNKVRDETGRQRSRCTGTCPLASDGPSYVYTGKLKRYNIASVNSL